MTIGWGLSTLDFNGPRRTAALEVRGLDRIGQPLTKIVAVQLHSIHDNLERRSIFQRRGVDLVERHGALAHQESTEPLPAECVHRGDNRGAVDRTRGIPAGIGCGARFVGRNQIRQQASSLVGAFGNFVHRLDGVTVCRRGDFEDGQIESDHQAHTGRQLRQLPRDHLCRLAHDLASAAPAERAPDAGVQQPHVIVDFGRRADRRSRIADAVLLADRNGRRDAVDAVDVRLLHTLEKLPRVCRQRLDIAPLALRVDRVERERRLARSADAGHDDQLSERQREIDILEVMRPRTANDEIGGFSSPGIRLFGHARCTTLRLRWLW